MIRVTGIWIPVLAALLGALGIGTSTMRGFYSDRPAVLRGAFWESRDPDGRLRTVKADGAILLDAGEEIRLQEEQKGKRAYQNFTFEGSRERESAFFEVLFRPGEEGALCLRVSLDTDQGILLAQRQPGKNLKILAQRKDRNFVGPPHRRIRVRLDLEGPELAVSINGEAVLSAETPPWSGGAVTLTARGGPVRIYGLSASGRVRDSEGRYTPFDYTDDLSALPPASPWPEIAKLLLCGALAVGGAFLLVRAFCLGRPSTAVRFRATLLFLFPPSLYFAAGLFCTLSVRSPVLLVLFPLGLGFALYTLRGALRERTVDGIPGRLGAYSVALLLAGLAAFAAGAYEARFYAISLRWEQQAQQASAPEPYDQDGPVILGPHNAVFMEGKYRNADLKAKVILEPEAVLQVRLRAHAKDQAEGISLFLSAHPGFATGFYLETHDDFKPVGSGSTLLTPGSPLDLTIRARGRSFEALMDGEPLAAASQRIFPAGGTVLLAAAGRATVEDLRQEPVSFEEPGATPFLDHLFGAGPVLLFFLCYAALASRILSLPLHRVMEANAFGLLPAAYVYHRALPEGLKEPAGTAGILFITVMIGLFFLMVHGRRLPLWRYGVLSLLVLIGPVMVFASLEEEASAWPASYDKISRLSLADWHGDRLDPDLIHFQHPFLRRWNHYLARHLFRGRSVAIEKPPGTTRILALGTSSTYGYRVKEPYAFRLEKRLKAEGFDVEVMIGAFQGGSGSRLLPFFRNVLLEFSPDIVTLSLYFNDAYALTQIDEADYLERVTDPAFTRSTLDRFRDRMAVREGAERIQAVMGAFRNDRNLFQPAGGPDNPPARFEAMLRRYAELTAARGVQLVLIKEPLAGDKDRIWKEEFYQAMDRVGQAFGLPVVNPTPLLNARGGARLFRDDVHPYDQGDAVVAEALYPAITQYLKK